MTTIISNGYYLLADHRQTQKYDTDTEIGKSIDIYSNHKHGVLLDKVVIDTTNKITIFEDVKHIYGYKVKAMACSGKVSILDDFTTILSSIKKGEDASILMPMLKNTITLSKESVSIIFITEDNLTLRCIFEYENDNMYVTTHNPGEIVAIGEGAGIVQGLVNFLFIKRIDILMPIVGLSCTYTSSSYSVYGNRENHLYASVFMDIAECKAVINESVEKYLKYIDKTDCHHFEPSGYFSRKQTSTN